MATPAVPNALLQQALDAYHQHNANATHAAAALGLNRSTFQERVEKARRAGLKPNSSGTSDESALLRAEVKRLRADLLAAQQNELTHKAIRRSIIGLNTAVEDQATPDWVHEALPSGKQHGVPAVFLSDFHWGEVVKSSQIGGVNKFNMDIANRRLSALSSKVIHLLEILDPKMDYPGIVVMLGGDMISGNIHEELQATNEVSTMPTVLDLFGRLSGFIQFMADTFGRVFLPCVTGNHGRDTHKMWAKDRHHTSFDWLLYCLLAKRFEGDKRITFQIPDGPDALFRIYGQRYLLTHGDQFRGGDGMIGALGPIIRGDHKKRSRNGQVGMGYDVLAMGHWHQYIHLTRLIVNGSLKGYDEYAYSGNFPFEPPQQALWITHPQNGITYRMPVFLSDAPRAESSAWVSVK